jgi:hypothetical protein
MSEEKKISAKDLFKDYVPEVVEYDSRVDAQFPRKKSVKTLYKETLTTIATEHKIEIPAAEMFKNYQEEVLEYDEKNDGSDEYKIRDTHLSVKEALVEKIRKAKAARKSNQTTFRTNIRTENEQ